MTTQARIARLALRAHNVSGATARVATERRLQALDWHPPGMPPSGILLIRRIDDPLPGGFDPGGSVALALAEWRAALRNRLGVLFEGALRPRNRAAARQSGALYFSCLAELLAWLVCDLADGSGGWWRRPASQSLRDHGIDDIDLRSAARPGAILGAAPAQMPAVMCLLADRGLVMGIVETLSDTETRSLLRALAGVFGFDPVLVCEPEATAYATTGAAGHTVGDGPSRDPELPFTRPGPPRAEDVMTVPGAIALPPRARALLDLCLTLHSRPVAPRDRRFAEAARRWWQAVENDGAATDHGPRAEPGARKAAPSDTRPRVEGGETGSSATTRQKPHLAGLGDSAPQPACDADDGRDRAASAQRTAPAAGAAQPAHRDTAAEAVAEVPVPGDTTPPQTTADRPSPGADGAVEPSAESPVPGDRIVTRLGGLLYVIHCLDDLGIPGDAVLGWPVERAGAWGALRGIGRSLVALAGVAKTDDDAIWDALTTLEPPLDTVDAPYPDLRAPAPWPGQLGDTGPDLCWASAGGRLRLWSEAGYILADVARDARHAAAQAAREAARYSGACLSRSTSRAAPLLPRHPALEPGLAEAARALTPAVARRLRLALGLAPGDREGLRSLLQVTATLCLSPSHIDLVARLDQISLPVRRAGLDRDPGWRADFGRVILFHFH